MAKRYSQNEINEQSKTYERGIFGSQANPEARFISSHNIIEEYARACRTLGLSIVLTSGTFDLLHVGHAKYLEEAKKYGDVLIVGVDSDEKVRARKGPDRPVVPEAERVMMLAHIRSVDVLTLKYPDEPKWDLIKRISPDTLIVTEETYGDDTLNELSQYCGQVISLEPQATTSTSAQIRRLQVGWSSKILEPVEKVLEKHNASEEIRKAIGGILLSGRNNE